MGGSSLPRNKADKATRPDRTATAAGPPGRGGHTQTAALRPPSCGPHSWPLTHSFQTVGSTLKPGDPTPGPAAGSSAFPTSLLLQETGRGSGRSGCWNLRAAPDSQIDQCLVWPLWLDPDPDGSVTARNKEPCFLLHNMERFTRSSWLILSLALLESNTDKQMASHRAGFQPLPLAGGSPRLGQCRGRQGARSRDPGTQGA